MCDDSGLHGDAHHHEYEVHERDSARRNRREFLQGAFATGALALAGGLRPGQAQAAAGVSVDGLKQLSMAMHVHSVFSEGSGSMEAQLSEATKNNYDVLWWTDHEYKMRAYNFKSRVHFTSLTNETTHGPVWQWVEQRVGSLTSRSTGGISASNSPNDPIASGSLRTAAESTSSALARQGYLASAAPARQQRTNVYGQVWTVDILPLAFGPRAYLEMLIELSMHPAQSGRPAGKYQISYRVGGSGVPGTRTALGNSGVVTLAAATGRWSTITAAISDDIAALWPGMNARDFTTFDVRFNAVSSGGFAQGNFDYLRINRPYTTGDVPLQIQDSIADRYAARFPVAQRQGLEISFGNAHVNWFGGAVSIPPVYRSTQWSSWDHYLVDAVAQVHSAGGLASLNHPYGSGPPTTPQQTPAAQDAALSRLATQLLGNNVYDADIIEVGYPKRNGYDLRHHIGLWDVLSRNGKFLTGNGVNDDHNGSGWLSLTNNWLTMVWAPSNSESDLLTALRAGRAWATSGRNRIGLDLLVDGVASMGSVSTSALTTRRLRIYASALPVGSTVEVLRGRVDYAGSANAVPNTVAVARYPASEFVGGMVERSIDTTTSCFVRVAVRDAGGVLVATSNPVWMLRNTPSSGIPTARQQ